VKNIMDVLFIARNNRLSLEIKTWCEMREETMTRVTYVNIESNTYRITVYDSHAGNLFVLTNREKLEEGISQYFTQRSTEEELTDTPNLQTIKNEEDARKQRK
jgi:hypothetical protein